MACTSKTSITLFLLIYTSFDVTARGVVFIVHLLFGLVNYNKPGKQCGSPNEIISCLFPRYNNRHQFLQLDLGRISKIIRVATQGRAMASQWVTVYYLSFSVDGVHFARYRKNSRDKVRKIIWGGLSNQIVIWLLNTVLLHF